MKTTYADYSLNVKWTPVNIYVEDATCDCSLLEWDTQPTIIQTVDVDVAEAAAVTISITPATPNEDSKSASQAIAKCYADSESCDETSTFSLLLSDSNTVDTAGFITVSGDSTEITVQPIAPEHIGTWTIVAMQDTMSGGNPEFDAITITVGCTITSFDAQAPPDTQVVNLFTNAPFLIDISTWTYTMVPSCGYTVSNAFSWTIPEDAPIKAVSTLTSQ